MSVLARPCGGVISRIVANPVFILDALTLVASSPWHGGGSFSVSGGNAARELVVITLEESFDCHPTAVTYGTESMAQRAFIDVPVGVGADFGVSLGFWGLNDAGLQAAASTTIVVTRNDTLSSAGALLAMTLGNVSQTTPVADNDSAQGDVANPSGINLDVIAGNFALSAFASTEDGNPSIAWSGITERFEQNSSFVETSVAYDFARAAATLPISATQTPTPTDKAGILGIVYNHAGIA